MMRTSKIVATFAILGVAAIATADSVPPAAPAPAPAAQAQPAKQLTIQEMRQGLEKIRAQVEADFREVMHVREIAKKNKDVIKLNCVNDKLVLLKAQQNVADTSGEQLTGSLDSNNDERFSQYASLDATAGQIKSLREQAQACVGELDVYKQESGIEVTKPDIVDDPTVTPFPPDSFDVEPPGYASPFD
jgi:hypothetical protein